jgi:hypothetical protein
MPLEPRIEEALKDSFPLERLRALALHWKGQGKNQAEMLSLFEQARCQLRDAGRDRDEDIVLEVMDFLIGWCSPHLKI